jgi:hypothetical protein
LRGRRTLEEGGPDVVVGCYNVVLTWLVRARPFDQGGEEEDGDEEVEGCGGLMIGCVGENEEYDSDDCRKEDKRFPSADF